MNRRTFFSRLGGVMLSLVCAPFAKKVVRFPRYVASGSHTTGTAFWTPNDGSFIVPPHLVKPLQKFLKDGGVIEGEPVEVDMTPRTLEEVCKARGIKYQCDHRRRGGTV